ncbi:MAG: hypothetical protein JSV68_21850 [Anaerolineaceae bacterium]|nr:MAG: hypothetical protein JSV68_21850 [Anaerolineaceae bacterium]
MIDYLLMRSGRASDQCSFSIASRRWLTRTLNRAEVIAVPGLLLVEVAGTIARRTADPQLGHRAVEHVANTRLALTAWRTGAGHMSSEIGG